MKKIKVILIEDDEMLSTVFTMFLNDLDYELVGNFYNPEDAFSKIESLKPDIILMDIIFPGKITGIDAAKIINEKFDIPIIFVSSASEEETINSAISTKAYGYIVKPIDKTNLKITIDIAHSKYNDSCNINTKDTVLDNISTGVFTIDKKGNVLYINNYAISLFGLTKTQNKIPNIDAILSDSGIDFIDDVFPNLHKSNEHNIEIINNNNKLNIKFIAEKDNNNLFDKIIAITSIVNESKYEYNINSIYDCSLEAMILVNDDFKITEYNKLATKYFASFFDSDIRKGCNILESLSFLNKMEFSNLFENTIDGISHYLERMIKIGNVEKYFKITIFPVIEGKDKVKKFYITFYDITNVKETERLFDEIKSELKPLFESSIQRFYLCDLSYKIVSFNKAAQLVIYNEFNRHLKKGDNILDFIPNNVDKELFINKFEEVKKGKRSVFKESIVVKGNNYWNESHLDPIINERGEISKVLLWTLDITEREENTQIIEETKERIDLITKGGNDGIWDWDIKNNKVYLSPRWKEVLGYTEDEITEGLDIYNNLIHPDDLLSSQETLSKYLKNEIDDYYLELRLLTKQGNYLWVASRGVALRGDDNIAVRLAGSITNITKYKEKEEELTALNNSIREKIKIFNKGDVVIVRFEANDISKLSFVSENVKDILGYTQEEFLNKEISFKKIIVPDDYERHLKEIDDSLKSNKSYIEFSNYAIITKSGKKIWVKNFSTIIVDAETNKTEIFGYFINITNKIEIEERLKIDRLKYEKLYAETTNTLKESYLKISNMYNAVPDLIFEIDKDGKYLDFKLDSKNLLAINPQDIIGKSLNDFFDIENAKIMLDKIKSTIKTKEIEFFRYKMQSALGMRNFEARLSPITKSTILTIVRDITIE